MQAVKGYFTGGWFTPIDNVVLPHHTQAILVVEEPLNISSNEVAGTFWHDFDRMVDESIHEEMPEFSRMQLQRELVSFTED